MLILCKTHWNSSKTHITYWICGNLPLGHERFRGRLQIPLQQVIVNVHIEPKNHMPKKIKMDSQKKKYTKLLSKKTAEHPHLIRFPSALRHDHALQSRTAGERRIPHTPPTIASISSKIEMKSQALI